MRYKPRRSEKQKLTAYDVFDFVMTVIGHVLGAGVVILFVLGVWWGYG